MARNRGSIARRAVAALAALAVSGVAVVAVEAVAPAVVGASVQIASTTRSSVRDSGAQLSTGPSMSPSAASIDVVASGDGRFVGFSSFMDDVVPDKTNGTCNDDSSTHWGVYDAYVRDTVLGRTTRVSLTSDGGELKCPLRVSGFSAGMTSRIADISYDGRYVLFISNSATLGIPSRDPGSNGFNANAFIRDRDTDGNGIFDEEGGTATLPVSVSAVFGQVGAAMQRRGGGGSPGDSPGIHNIHADLSGDGRFATFTADWSVLSGGSQSYRQDIVVYDRDVDGNGVFDEPGTTNLSLVSASGAGDRGNANSYYPVVSDDGRYVTFLSVSTNLVTGVADGRIHVYTRDRDADGDGVFDESGAVATTLQDRTDAGAAGNDNAVSHVDMSGDGRYVVFTSSATNLVSGDTEFCGSCRSDDVFIRDRDADADAILDETGVGETSTTLASTTSASIFEPGNPDVRIGDNPSISRDGRWVAFRGWVQKPSGPIVQSVVVRDPSGALTVVSVDRTTGAFQDGAGANRAAMSRNGNFVAFESFSANLVSGDTNARMDVFQTNIVQGAPTALTVDMTPDATVVGPGATEIPLASIPTDRLRTMRPDLVNAAGRYKTSGMQRHAGTGIRRTSGTGQRKYSGSGQRKTSGGYPPNLLDAPLNRVASRLAAVPTVRAIALSDIPVVAAPLGTTKDSWDELLVGTALAGRPANSITFGQVLDLLVGTSLSATHDLRKLGIGAISREGSPLAAASIAGLQLGATPVQPLVYNDGQSWCTKFNALAAGATSCAALGVTATSGTTMLELDFDPSAAAVLNDNPTLRRPPIVPNLVRLRSAVAPILSAYLADLGLRVARIGNLSLAAALTASSALRATPLDSIADRRGDLDGLAICDGATYDCSGRTLGDAQVAGALLPDLHLRDLTYFLDASDATLDDIAALLPNDVDINDLAVATLEAADFPWEDIDVESAGLVDYAPSGSPVIHYAVGFRADGGTGPFEARVVAELPARTRFVTGSSSLPGAAPVTDPVVEYLTDRTRLTWLVRGVGADTDYDLAFDARPGIRLGTFTGPGAQVRIGAVTGSSNPVQYTVTDSSDAGATRGTAAAAGTDSLRLGYIGAATDVDLYTFEPPTAQSVVSIRLSHLAGDGDLVLYGPPKPTGIADRTVAQVPIADSTADGAAPAEQVAPEPTDDVPLVGDATPLAVASSRGSSTEAAQVIAPRLIQVSSYDGVTSEKPYVLRVRVDAQPAAPACPAYSRSGGSTGTAPDLSTLRSDLHTVILWNQRRMGDRYGQTAANALRAKLEAFAARSEVRGAVVPLDALLADQYAAWDANPCNPELANEVVRGAQQILAGIAAPWTRYPDFSWGSVENPQVSSSPKVVVVGGDDMVPMARLLDPTTTANESSYANRFGASPFGESLDLGYMRTDDPYGAWRQSSSQEPPWLSDSPFDLFATVGRLVETPTEIGNAIDVYTANDGILDPGQAYAAGYDFMADGAGALRDALSTALTNASGGTAPTVSSALSNSWTRSNLLAGLASGPDLAGVYGHFEYDAGLTAAGWSTGSGETFSPGDLASTLGTGARMVLSMGCHSGLSVPDSADVAGIGTSTGDFAQALQGVGAVYVAASGFGYGTDGSVGLHERLLQQFAMRLDGSMRVGDALALAKALYWLGAGLYGGYDLKAIATTTFYGLPHYRVGPTWRTPSYTNEYVATSLDETTGLQTADFATGTIDFTRTDTTNGSYFAVQAAGGSTIDPLVLRGRPTQPRLDVDVTASPSVGSAHGVLVTGLRNRATGAGYDPTVGFDGLFGAPTLNGAAVVEPVGQDVAFPARAATITSAVVPGSAGAGAPPAPRQHVVLVPGWYSDDGIDDAAGVGVQRLYDSMRTRVFYSTSTDIAPPTLSGVTGEVVGSTVTVSAAANDTNGVERVVALVDPGTPGSDWRRVELHLVAGRWTGSGALPTTAVAPRFIVQAVDAAGNVAVSSAKGRRYALGSGAGRSSAPTAVAADGSYLQIAVSWDEPVDPGTEPVSGYAIWSGTTSGELSHLATVSAAARSFVHDGVGGTRRYAVQALTAAGPGELSDEVVATATTDATPPTITVSAPADGANVARGTPLVAEYTCDDEAGGSGVASCVGTLADGAAIDTSVLGDQEFSVTATDGAGNTATRTVSYRVVPVMSVSSSHQVEGDAGKSLLHLHVSLSEPSTATVTARYRTLAGTAGTTDFVAVPERTLTFRPGQVSKTISVKVTPDTAVEGDESFSIVLSALSNAVADGLGNTQTIVDDESGSPERVAIGDVRVVEGRSKSRAVHLMVSLASPATAPLTVPYSTNAGTATGSPSSRLPGDFRLRTGTVTFAVGQQVKVIAVLITPDADAEGDETFTVTLGGTAELSRSVGTVTIVDDD